MERALVGWLVMCDQTTRSCNAPAGAVIAQIQGRAWGATLLLCHHNRTMCLLPPRAGTLLTRGVELTPFRS